MTFHPWNCHKCTVLSHSRALRRREEKVPCLIEELIKSHNSYGCFSFFLGEFFVLLKFFQVYDIHIKMTHIGTAINGGGNSVGGLIPNIVIAYLLFQLGLSGLRDVILEVDIGVVRDFMKNGRAHASMLLRMACLGFCLARDRRPRCSAFVRIAVSFLHITGFLGEPFSFFLDIHVLRCDSSHLMSFIVT